MKQETQLDSTEAIVESYKMDEDRNASLAKDVNALDDEVLRSHIPSA